MGAASYDKVAIPETSGVFQARMEAQCEEIKQYRLSVKQEEGRELSLEQAAREWIESYAVAFAQDNDEV